MSNHSVEEKRETEKSEMENNTEEAITNEDSNHSDADTSDHQDHQNESLNEESANNSSSEEKELTQEEKIAQELESLKREVANYKDSWQRERAEFVNYKKRTAMELLNSRKEAVRQFIHDLLHPMDNLDMVTNINSEDLEENPKLKAFVDGVVMVKKDFLGIMDKEGVKKMKPLNESFDPMTMEAISSEESEEYKEETVIEVYQPGYYYEEGETKHSIRPARVKVGKPVS